MEKQKLKWTPKEIAAVALVWLFAISMVYIVYVKIKMLHP
jgi:hypothetical protein